MFKKAYPLNLTKLSHILSNVNGLKVTGKSEITTSGIKWLGEDLD